MSGLDPVSGQDGRDLGDLECGRVEAVTAGGADEASVDEAGQHCPVYLDVLVAEIRVGIGGCGSRRRGWGVHRADASVELFEGVLDDFQGKVTVALGGQDVAEAFDICGGVVTVSGRGADRFDKALVFKEPELGVGDRGELGL